jgi:hypothetical protein
MIRQQPAIKPPVRGSPSPVGDATTRRTEATSHRSRIGQWIRQQAGFPNNAHVLRGIYGRQYRDGLPRTCVRPAAWSSPGIRDCNRTEPPALYSALPAGRCRTRRRRNRTRAIRLLAHLLGRIGEYPVPARAARRAAGTRLHGSVNSQLSEHHPPVRLQCRKGWGFSRGRPEQPQLGLVGSWPPRKKIICRIGSWHGPLAGRGRASQGRPAPSKSRAPGPLRSARGGCLPRPRLAAIVVPFEVRMIAGLASPRRRRPPRLVPLVPRVF